MVEKMVVQRVAWRGKDLVDLRAASKADLMAD